MKLINKSFVINNSSTWRDKIMYVTYSDNRFFSMGFNYSYVYNTNRHTGTINRFDAFSCEFGFRKLASRVYSK